MPPPRNDGELKALTRTTSFMGEDERPKEGASSDSTHGQREQQGEQKGASMGRLWQDETGALGRRIERAGHESECVSILIL